MCNIYAVVCVFFAVQDIKYKHKNYKILQNGRTRIKIIYYTCGCALLQYYHNVQYKML